MKKLLHLSPVVLACAVTLFGSSARAQSNIDSKVEAYRKSLEADNRRRESVWKGNALEWDDLVDGTPWVVAFGVNSAGSARGFDISGPYLGYMMNKNFELGLDSEFYTASVTSATKVDPKTTVKDTNRRYFFGIRFTGSAPLSSHLVVFASVSPGLFGSTTSQKTTVGNNAPTTTNDTVGPAFSLRMAPVGLGWRTTTWEFRTGMYLTYYTGGGDVNTADVNKSGFGFEHATGNLEVRHYF